MGMVLKDTGSSTIRYLYDFQAMRFWLTMRTPLFSASSSVKHMQTRALPLPVWEGLVTVTTGYRMQSKGANAAVCLVM